MLAQQQIDKLRANYGTAYVTHALDDLHTNSLQSPVMAMLGIDSGERGAWSTATALIGDVVKENTSVIKNKLINMNNQKNGLGPQLFAIIGETTTMRLDMDGFSTLIDNISNGVSDAFGELIEKFKLFCGLLKMLFVGDALTLQSVAELQNQANTWWKWLTSPIEAIKWMWIAARTFMRYISQALHWCMDEASQFIGTIMELSLIHI